MLATMTSCEYGEWVSFYRTHWFADTLLDAQFASLSATLVNLACRSTDFTPEDFSLLTPQEVEPEEMDDDTLMLAASGLFGGVRYGGDPC
jgi:phage tail assembly protein T